MIRFIPVVALLALGAPAFGAGSPDSRCDPNPARTVAAFERAKDAFYRGEFSRFAQVAQPFAAPGVPTAITGLLPVGAGFEACASVVFRRDAPGLYQEVILFRSGSRLVGLYLQGAEIEGEIEIIGYRVSDRPATVLEFPR